MVDGADASKTHRMQNLAYPEMIAVLSQPSPRRGSNGDRSKALVPRCRLHNGRTYTNRTSVAQDHHRACSLVRELSQCLAVCGVCAGWVDGGCRYGAYLAYVRDECYPPNPHDSLKTRMTCAKLCSPPHFPEKFRRRLLLLLLLLRHRIASHEASIVPSQRRRWPLTNIEPCLHFFSILLEGRSKNMRRATQPHGFFLICTRCPLGLLQGFRHRNVKSRAAHVAGEDGVRARARCHKPGLRQGFQKLRRGAGCT